MNDKPSLLNVKDGKIEVKLSELETEVLISVLQFANSAANLIKSTRDSMSQDDIGKRESQRLSVMAADASELIRIIAAQAIKSDEPVPELKH
jgi:hypothetical protein